MTDSDERLLVTLRCGRCGKHRRLGRIYKRGETNTLIVEVDFTPDAESYAWTVSHESIWLWPNGSRAFYEGAGAMRPVPDAIAFGCRTCGLNHQVAAAGIEVAELRRLAGEALAVGRPRTVVV